MELSVLLVCEFTLDLRRLNTGKVLAPNQSVLGLPTLSIQDNLTRSTRSVFQRLHQSIIADMGDMDGPEVVEGPEREE
ncbi:hypothetical protein Clacol_004327 [Clathrus columnatus]|uniref:Uncharacterized protein n=1 Tax=Clathrus columnatus TaxID=1419009 RepID=A0AAV5AC83_9AGAM|nr:hypothetical protein Clacol_004327 [Clathrus columnatus]